MDEIFNTRICSNESKIEKNIFVIDLSMHCKEKTKASLYLEREYPLLPVQTPMFMLTVVCSVVVSLLFPQSLHCFCTIVVLSENS